MKRPLALLSFVALVALIALVGGACGSSVRPPAATVNGTPVSQEQLDVELKGIAANETYLQGIESQGTVVRGTGKGTLATDFVAKVLTRQILVRMITNELKRRHLTVTAADRAATRADVLESVGGKAIFDKFPADYQQLLQQRNAEVLKLESTLGKVTTDDAAVQKYYDAHKDQFSQTCVSHILFAVLSPSGAPDQAATAAQADQLKAQAAAAKAQIDGGADFAAVAKAQSQDASNKDQGGDLQCGAGGRFVAEFEDAMAKLKVGEVSDPVQTQFGIHLIKVTDRKADPLAKVAGQVRQQILSESGAQQALSSFLQSSVGKGTFSVNPRYGTFDKNGAQPGVVPPVSPATTTTSTLPPNLLAPLQNSGGSGGTGGAVTTTTTSP